MNDSRRKASYPRKSSTPSSSSVAPGRLTNTGSEGKTVSDVHTATVASPSLTGPPPSLLDGGPVLWAAALSAFRSSGVNASGALT
eukprot:CAMPEP_0185761400 /NCGR_PEP_ID=MMETSP1174-20130828/20329_1 /TAXON_ID=35687 /ORGANISM="Dictyocha speculum, Strain CCMP1381" /LENGTH=84 /DNA_ID=CAMNT_0028442629 /DNA_START=163 /DNA_END=413 /DNA_ORIENTATION=+